MCILSDDWHCALVTVIGDFGAFLDNFYYGDQSVKKWQLGSKQPFILLKTKNDGWKQKNNVANQWGLVL